MNKYITDVIGFRKSKISKDTIITFSGNLVNALLVFGYTVVVSRNMDIENFGIFSFALAILTVVIELSDSGLTTAVVRFASQYIAAGKRGLAHAIFLLTLRYRILVALVMSLLGIAFAPWLADFVFSKPEVSATIQIAFIAVFFINLQNFISSVFLSHRQFVKKVSYNIIISGLKISILAGFIYLLQQSITPIYAVWVIIASTLIGLAIGYILMPKFPLKKQIDTKEYLKIRREIFHFSKWILVSTIAGLILLRVDTFLLTRLVSLAEVGLFNAAYNFSMFFHISAAALGTALLPYVSGFDLERVKRLYLNLFKLLPLVVVGVAILVWLAKYILLFVYGDRYIDSVSALQILFISGGLVLITNPLFIIFYRLKKARVIALINLGQVIIGICLNLVLIPEYGIKGPAISALIFNLFAFVLILWLTYHQIYRKYASNS
ncbi:flippase [Patescibacteria group bacterium]|nr:flippase [Patescibacteria group bacterium]MBU1890859.1 flippase [Patescibacteria group bacterium]